MFDCYLEKKVCKYFSYFFRKKLSRKTKFIKKLYKDLEYHHNFNDEYIYFAAPYQPEVYSNLVAGIYEDIFIIIDMLSYSMPDDWLIYYKEHPNTFKEDDKGALERNADFYFKLN